MAMARCQAQASLESAAKGYLSSWITWKPVSILRFPWFPTCSLLLPSPLLSRAPPSYQATRDMAYVTRQVWAPSKREPMPTV